MMKVSERIKKKTAITKNQIKNYLCYSKPDFIARANFYSGSLIIFGMIGTGT